jgi:plastocyanin
MFRFSRRLVIAATLLAAGCGGSAPASSTAPASGPDPAHTAAISGRVTFDGPAPASEVVRIDGDRNCVSLVGTDRRPAEYVVPGDDQTLQNVFVYVKSGLETHAFPVPANAVVIDQQQCRYLPRVVGVRVGQPLEVRNSDPLLHNVRAEGAINQPFNQGQPVQGMKFSHTFTTREVMVPLTCDVHAWMNAYVGALEHPYFSVTGQDGTYALPRLPPGTYTVEAWHERLGVRSQQVVLGPGEAKDVVFTYPS